MLKKYNIKKIIYKLQKKNILNISSIELLNRNFFLSKEINKLDKQISKFYIGKRNNFFILNLEICLFNLKKSVNLIIDIFYFKLNSQFFFFYQFESEFNLMIKNLIKITNLKKKKKNKFISFLKQIYFLGKWKSGSISNILKIMRHMRLKNRINFNLYKTLYPKKKEKKNIYYLFFLEKFYLKKYKEKYKKSFKINKRKKKIVKKKKKINFFFNKKKIISRLFFKKENYILLKKIPDGVITLSKNDILSLEAKYMNITNIAINEPDKNMYNTDYTITSNSSTRVLFLLYLNIFRSCIFIGRLLKLNSLFDYYQNLNFKVIKKKSSLNLKRVSKILYYYKKF